MDETREECCDERADEPCCEAPCPGPEGSINTTGLNGIQFSDGMSYASSGTFHIGCDPQPKTKMKDVIIKEMDHGYLVKIGCQTLCIESPKKLLRALKKYMKDPGAVEDQHMGGEFMKSLD